MTAEHLEHRRTVIGAWCCRFGGTTGQSSFNGEMEKGQIFFEPIDAQTYDLPRWQAQDKRETKDFYNNLKMFAETD